MTEPKGRELSSALAGTPQQRMEEEERTILLKYIPGKRPEVVFTGFWTGKFIKGAINAISRAYRLRKYRPSRPTFGGVRNATMDGGEKKEVNHGPASTGTGTAGTARG